MDGSVGLVGGEGCIECCLPFVVNVDVVNAAVVEAFVDFVYFSFAFEVGCKGFFFRFDKFGDFCLSVGLEFVECVGVVLVRVGSCVWVVYVCVDEFFGQVEERCDFGAFGLKDFDVVFFVEGLLHDFF